MSGMLPAVEKFPIPAAKVSSCGHRKRHGHSLFVAGRIASPAMSRRARGRERLAGFFVLALLLAACSGHTRIARTIDSLDLPGELTQVGEFEGGPNSCFAGDCPSVDRFYVSQSDSDDVCASMRKWATANGLSERSAGELTSCRFYGRVSSTDINIHVSPPMDEIPPVGNAIKPTPIDIDHQAVVGVSAQS
jgi:hypothetical protein